MLIIFYEPIKYSICSGVKHKLHEIYCKMSFFCVFSGSSFSAACFPRVYFSRQSNNKFTLIELRIVHIRKKNIRQYCNGWGRTCPIFFSRIKFEIPRPRICAFHQNNTTNIKIIILMTLVFRIKFPQIQLWTIILPRIPLRVFQHIILFLSLSLDVPTHCEIEDYPLGSEQ